LQTKLKEILTVEDFLENLDEESLIDFNGTSLSAYRLPDFQSRETTYRSKYALLNNQILIISTTGKPSPYDIKSAIEQQISYFKNKGLSNIDLVWNVKSLGQPGIRIRKAMIEGNRKLAPYLKSRYLIVPPNFKTLIRIFKFIYQPKVEHLFFVDTIDEALCAITTGCGNNNSQEVSFKLKWPSKTDLLKMSKEELADMIVDYSQKHEASTNKILEALGHISWGGRFNKVEIIADENDMHFEMVNAFSLLQQDVEEIIREYKELNQNLELKVAERIVDFIDKESNLRSILDNSDRMTWLMNNRFELIDFNTAFINEIKRRYKVNPKINDNVLDFISNEREKSIWQERFDAALEGRAGIYLDQDLIDGDERVYEIKTFPIKEIGKIKGVSVFIEDITQLKHSQLKLIEKNRDLQKVNSELDSFVYRVSHDLRAPLTSILGLIILMKIETNHEKIGEYIGLQEKSILKLDLFIKEIINLSRNSRLGITVSEIDFEGLINEIFESQHYSSSSDNIQRLIEVEDNISFFTDRQRLSIILNNLISNGLKYVNPHEASPFVKVKVSSLEEKCLIEVIDNGIGISETYLPKIFEMFFRATQEFSGSGLGLYIVKETVGKLKGKITVKSKMRQGSVFKVVLPNLKERYEAAPKLEE
jgi:PAS domain S-box-containing protein